MISPKQEHRIAALLTTGRPAQEIARRARVSESSVRERMRRRQVRTPRRDSIERIKANRQVIESNLRRGHSYAAIALVTGVSLTPIHHIARQIGIWRQPGDPPRDWSGLREMVRSGPVIEAARQYGVSRARIYEILAREKITPPNRRKS